jgi:hypothetical protein
MRKLFKKVMAVTLSATMVVGMASAVSAAVATGTDVSNGKKWSSYSIHTREDKGEWEDKLKAAGQFYNTNVTEASGLDSHLTYGENAKISSQTSSSFTMDVTSTGWSATWKPDGTVAQSNPWGVTATKVVNVERGRYYTISFKIKSTLSNELMKEKERKDGTYYNVGTGKYNYIKHIHFKAYDNTDPDGAALTITNLKATIGGKSALETNKTKLKDFSSLIKLDSQNTADDGWVTVSATVLIPSEKSDYQEKKSNPTMGFKFAFGAFLKEYSDESNMSGTIEVKDYTVKAGAKVQKPAQVKGLKVKAKKKAIVVKFKKATKAKKYQVVYSTKSNFKGAKTKTTSKTSITISKLTSKKKYFVKVRAYYTTSGSKVYGAYSTKKSATVK